ncbi:probable ATP-dependent RNA helicase ddx17 [Paramacrobiotus metropolitanus]|uniref:probable ATP-dependent RNA helicase ddx17 n=1 Tax=Paramacrobiotus metropolitanus TaxID=2943436 RepID=UPI002445959D|nr:probable ATP-dependent RNA helicase ddx17 [Paramacrobiotus metropolitanus]
MMALIKIKTFPLSIFALAIILKWADSQRHSDRHLDDGYGVTQDYGNTYAISQDLYNPDQYNNYPNLPIGDPSPTHASNHDPYAELQGTRESETTGDQDTWDGYAGDQAATTPAAERQTAGYASYDPYGARGYSGNYDPYGGRRSEAERGGDDGQTDTQEEVTTQSSAGNDPYQTRDPYAQDRERNQAGGSDSDAERNANVNRDNYNTVDPYAYATTTAIPWVGNYGDRHTQDQSVSGASGYNPYATGRQAASGSSSGSSYDPYNRDTVDRQSATPEPYQYPEATTSGYDPYGSVAATPYDPYASYRTSASNYDHYETTTQNPYDNSYYQTQAPNDNYGSQYGNNYDPYARAYETTTINYWNTPSYAGQDSYAGRYQTTTQDYWRNRNYGGQVEASTQSPYQYDRQTTQSYYSGGYNYGNQDVYATPSPYNHYSTATPYNAYGNQYYTTPRYNSQGYGNGYNGGSYSNNYGNGYGQGSYSSSNSYSSYGNGNYAATTPAPTCIQYNPVSNGNGGNGGHSPPASNSGESCCTFYRNGMTCQECTTIQGSFFARRTTCSGSSSWSFGKK